MSASRACARCLARAWLLGRLAGHLDLVRARIGPLLELDEPSLIAAIAGGRADAVTRELGAFDPEAARRRCSAAGLAPICRCDREYPAALAQLGAVPAVLHVGGGLERCLELLADQPVAIVGARRASAYGTGVARSLARGVGAAGVTVISGMAPGIDTAAHEGAVAGAGATIAVLPGGADRAYPASARALHRRIGDRGAVVSELPPGVRVRRWMFPARNRIIAGLSAMTVVVEARRESGALLTADAAIKLGRALGAVPGRVTSPLAQGPHELLRSGASLISGAQDVLDGLFGAGVRCVPARPREPLAPHLQAVLDAVSDGDEIEAALARAGCDPDRGLAALASLELAGRLLRRPGGGFSVLD